MKKYPLRLLTAFLFLSGAAHAGSNDSLQITNLQREVHALNDSVALYRKAQLQDVETIRLLSEIKKAASEPIWVLLLKGGVGLLLAGGLFLLFWWALNKLAPNWHITIIQKLVERYEEVNVLKRDKRVLLLNLAGTDPENRSFVEKLLREFNAVETFEIIDAYIKPTKNFDVVFANFEQGFNRDVHQPILYQYIDPTKHHATVLFALVPSGTWDYSLQPKFMSKVSIANLRAQVYGNLISLLKYHDLTNSKW